MAPIKELYVDSTQFSYVDGQQLLTGAFLKCNVGDVIGLLGRNGCGKSTFMQIIFGSLQAHHSYIRINGRKIRQAYLTGKIGYLPQHSFLPTHEKVSYIVDLLLTNRDKKQMLLDDNRVSTLKDKKIYQLSGGELRYLEICLLIHQPTDFLLLDEPFTGLEPIYMQYITELIIAHKDQKGFVISDHSYRHVLDIATQILLLQNGCCRPIRNRKELEFFYVPDGTFDAD